LAINSGQLSCVLSDLCGASGLRILRALAEGETDPKKLAALGDDRLKCTEEQLLEAWTGNVQAMHLELLTLYLQQLHWVDEQMEKLHRLIAQALKPHQEVVARRAEAPGFGPDSAQQVMAEVGVQASTFPSAGHLASWMGTCPGQEESAEENYSRRSAKRQQIYAPGADGGAASGGDGQGEPFSSGFPSPAAWLGL